MPTATAVLQYRVNGGLVTTGVSTVHAADVVALGAASYDGWGTPAARWEIQSYPPGWSLPSGWTLDPTTGFYFYLSTNLAPAPPSITIPGGGMWGVWIFALTVNGGGPELFDDTAGVQVIDPSGLQDLGEREGSQWGGLRGWAYKIQSNNRVLAAFINSGGGGGVGLGSGTPSPATAAAGSAGSATTAAPFDHAHQVTTATAISIALTAGAGSSTALARADHLHDLPFSVLASVLAGATSAINVNAERITNLGTPTPNSTDAATTAYVDAATVSRTVRGASLGNQSLTGNLAEDGLTYGNGDRYLAKNQLDATTNGIYVVNTAGAWARSSDMATSGQLIPGMVVLVSEGTANSGTGWALRTPKPITIGSTNLTFTEVMAPIDYNPTPDCVPIRGASGELLAVYYAPAATGVAGAGFIRLTAADQTVVALKGNTLATVPLLSTSGTGTTLNLGDGSQVTTVGFLGAALSQMGPATFSYGVTAIITQTVVPGTGAEAGSLLRIQGQAGQAQTGSAANNNGADVSIVGGAAGTGGSGAAGTQGRVILGGSKVILGGLLDAGGFKLTDLGTPTANSTDAATTAYVDAEIASAISGSALTPGNGLQATGTTWSVKPNPDGSIVVTSSGVGVGVLASDAQHGNRGNGALHSVATASVAGFMPAAMWATLTNATTSPTANTLALRGSNGEAGFGYVYPSGTVASATGFVRLPATATAIAFRNAANSGDFSGMTLDGANGLSIGDATWGTGYLTLNVNATGFLFKSNGTEVFAVDPANSNIRLGETTAQWLSGLTPVLTQAQASGTGTTHGARLTVRAQQGQNASSGTNNNGGDLWLAAGAAGTGGTGGAQGRALLQGGGVNAVLTTTGLNTTQFSTGAAVPATTTEAFAIDFSGMGSGSNVLSAYNSGFLGSLVYYDGSGNIVANQGNGFSSWQINGGAVGYFVNIGTSAINLYANGIQTITLASGQSGLGVGGFQSVIEFFGGRIGSGGGGVSKTVVWAEAGGAPTALPATGSMFVWADPTDHRIHTKDASGNISILGGSPVTLSPSDLDFHEYFRQQVLSFMPSSLTTLTDTMIGSLGRFSTYSEGTAKTPTQSAGQLTIANTAGENTILQEGAALTVPQIAVEAHIVSLTGATGAYANVGVGIILTTTPPSAPTFIFAAWEAQSGQAALQVKISGSSNFRASVSVSWTPPFDLGMSLVSNSLCLWQKPNGGQWTFITSWSLTEIDMRATTLSNWAPCFSFASQTNGTLVVDKFAVGSYGSVGIRDVAPVTSLAGSPILSGSVLSVTATLTDPAGAAYCGVLQVDLLSKTVNQVGVIFVNRAGKLYNDNAAHLIEDGSGGFWFFITTWGTPTPATAVQILVKHETILNLLSGVNAISSMVQPTLQGVPASGGLYDPNAVFVGGVWYLAVTAGPPTTNAFYPVFQSTTGTPDTGTWTLIGADPSLYPYEGSRIAFINGSYWVTWASVYGGVMYDLTFTSQGGIRAPFAMNQTTGYSSHYSMVTLPSSSTEVYLVTFTQDLYLGMANTMGRISLSRALSTVMT